MHFSEYIAVFYTTYTFGTVFAVL